MRTPAWRATALALALLTPGLAGRAQAQGGAWTVYFVFRLATTLPVTLQATPECVAERAALEGAAVPTDGPALRLLETYSFVSPLGPDELRRAVEAYAGELGFAGADPGPGEPDRGDRDFRGPGAPGYRYDVRTYPGPGGEAAGVLCVTVRSEPGADDPDPALPGDG